MNTSGNDMIVSFQGGSGSYSETIARKLYPSAKLLPCATFQETFDAVTSGKAKFAVIPIENSLTGKIREPTELLVSSSLTICKEAMLPIRHCLIANKGVSFGALREVYAHPEAFAQCTNFVRTSKLEPVMWRDGASAAGVIKQKKEACLIASASAAKIHGLSILRKGIQNSKNNMTRFFAIGKESSRLGNDKTTLVFGLNDEPGALVRALTAFSSYGVNLLRIESSPSQKHLWEYIFNMDIEGDKDAPSQTAAIKQLKTCATWVKILGSYPKGKVWKD